MQRLRNNDRGATAVFVALLMVPLLIFAALAIDVAAMHTDRQQLQTGADAAALAIAQDCAGGDCEPADATAHDMAAANKNNGDAAGDVLELDEAAGSVLVQTTTVREHWFAPIIGIHETDLEARAGARWGYPTGGLTILPLAIYVCELAAQTGSTEIWEDGELIGVDLPESTEEQTILFSKASDTDCTPNSGNVVPGGFGWLRPGDGGCGSITTAIDQWVRIDTGTDAPCNEATFQRWLGEPVLVPLFDDARDTGNRAEFHIIGYAAFTLTGYRFPGIRYNAPHCGGGENCIRGTFDRFVDLSDDFDYSPDGPRFGVAVVALTE
ncbi:TadE/TadG family type IV pilus assembly protein [Pseudactinotalea sp. Z1748]|uniref:TadE/TadG family type IV pilus assembly protein n=1 Tax=Pseudactinotalea sp. Z1748 TaxID=3413027 RepID=UPI003C7B9DEB